MKITINIKTDNAAFQNNKEFEVDRILSEVTSKIAMNYTSGVCIDFNGNNVGDWKVTDK